MDKEKDEISTRLRLPSDLHTRLSIMAKANQRSLHNYMLLILKDHILDFEKSLLDKFNEQFEEVYQAFFPYLEPLYFDERFDIKITPKGMLASHLSGSKSGNQSDITK